MVSLALVFSVGVQSVLQEKSSNFVRFAIYKEAPHQTKAKTTVLNPWCGELGVDQMSKVCWHSILV